MADRPRVLDTFLDAVRIDSPSGEEARFGLWCEQRLQRLGFEVRFDATADVTGSDTGNLIAERVGGAGGPTMVLSAHLDTVEPGRGIEPVVADGMVRSDGDTVLGADDKAGIAAVLEALERLSERGVATAPVRVLLTAGEEIGLLGAKAMDPADAAGDLCLVLDAHGPVGGVVTAAPTQYTFTAEFVGKPAHAGVEPERGVSAVAMAADAISHMRIGRLDAETTANVGEIHGGSATNVVTAAVRIRGECRSLDPVKVEDLRRAMDCAMREAAARAGGEVHLEWVKEYDGYRLDEDDPALDVVVGALRAIGREPELFPTGGGSDANVFAARGLTSIVLACGMMDVHGTYEYVEIEELDAMAGLVAEVLTRVAQR